MKYLILFLLPLISFAQFRLEITNSEGQQMSSECATTEECNAYIVKFKHKWGRDAGWLRSDCGNSTSTRVVTDPIDGDVTEYMCPATYTTNIVDISAESAFKNLQAMASKNMACGRSVKAFIGALNVSKGLNSEDIKTIMASYSAINSYLDGGAIDTAIAEINAMDATALITGADKTQIILKLQECKVTWQ